MKRDFLVLIIGLFAVAHVNAAFNYDPALHWQTLKTEHFAIHFHNGLQSLAPRVAAIAEQVHKELSPVFKWVPKKRTDIVLTDRVDYSNGSATMFPANRMVLIVSSPDEVRGLEDYSDHLRQLIRHEYVHILHIDKVAGLPLLARKVLGRNLYVFANALQPRWFLEGLATYMEADADSPYGRRQSSLFRALMRIEVEAGIKPLRQINQSMVSWPSGVDRYLYGVYFYQFVADRYGEEKVQELVDTYSRNIIPFLVNTTSKKVFAKDLSALWKEFEDYLEKRFRSEIAAIHTQGLHAGKRITNSAFLTGHPRVTSNGDMYYIENSSYRQPRLMRLAAGMEQSIELMKINGSRFDVHADAGVLLVQLDYSRSTNYFADLYRIDPATGILTRLTTGGRYRSATWSPDGRRIIAVQNDKGNNALHLLDSNGHLLEILWQGLGYEVIGQPDWSPDGKSLLAAVWRPQSDWNLELFSIEKRRWRPLTQTAEIETDPQFTANGDSIVFSADYGGVYNIYRLALETNRLERLTNVVGSGFLPSLSGDGRVLYYTNAHASGTDVYRLQLHEKDRALSVAPATPVRKRALSDKGKVTTGRISAYAPESGLAPTWWMPLIQATNRHTILSFLTSGSDPLIRHSYNLQLGYDLQNGLPLANVVYTYDRWHPTISLSFSRYVLDYFSSGSFDRFRYSDSFVLEAVQPFLSNQSQWQFHAAVLLNRESDAQNNASPLSPVNDNTLGLALSFNSSRLYPFSVSANDGRKVILIAEDSNMLAGDIPGQAYTLDWSEYFRLGGEHVLQARAVVGMGSGSQVFRLGGLGSGFSYALPSFSASSAISLFNRRRYSLRGYPAGLASLSGNQMFRGQVEWRFLIDRVERGLMAPPVGVHQLQGKLFVDAGATWNAGSPVPALSRGLGAELEVIMVAGYTLPMELHMGVAQGLDTGGERQVYFLFLISL